MAKLFTVFFKILSLAVAIVICLSLQEGVFARDECADLFFTPAWQECFSRKFQNNGIHNSRSTTRMEQNNFPFNFPATQPIINTPDMNDIIQNAYAPAQTPQAQDFLNSNIVSLSSSNSRSVISVNGRTLIIDSDGIPTSSSNFGNYQQFELTIGEPNSFLTSIGQTDNSLTINLGYSDGTKKRIKITLNSPTKASDLKLDRRNGILYIKNFLQGIRVKSGKNGCVWVFRVLDTQPQRMESNPIKSRIICEDMSIEKVSSIEPVPLYLPPGFEDRTRKRYTLALIKQNGQVLLGLKKRGFGIGLWNGFGGKIEPGETDHEAAAREIEEECGLVVKAEDLEEFGVILFEFLDNPILMEVHVFVTEKFTGIVHETDEMKPKWFPEDGFPHSQMWPDDEVWYPLCLRGQKFSGYFLFQGHTEIISYILRESSPNGKTLLEKQANLN